MTTRARYTATPLLMSDMPAGNVTHPLTRVRERAAGQRNRPAKTAAAKLVRDNNINAGRAAAAVLAYVQATNSNGEPIETVLTDLFEDLMHLGDALGLDVDHLHGVASDRYDDDVTL